MNEGLFRCVRFSIKTHCNACILILGIVLMNLIDVTAQEEFFIESDQADQPGILGKPRYEYLVEVFEVPDDSTFFWDKSPLYLKRKNPMASRLIKPDAYSKFRRSLILQGGQCVIRSLAPCEDRKQLVHQKKSLRYDGDVSLSFSTRYLENRQVQFHVRLGLNELKVINQIPFREVLDHCYYKEDLRESDTAFFLMRTKQPGGTRNYVTLISLRNTIRPLR